MLDVLLQSDSDAMLPRFGLAVMDALSGKLLELQVCVCAWCTCVYCLYVAVCCGRSQAGCMTAIVSATHNVCALLLAHFSFRV